MGREKGETKRVKKTGETRRVRPEGKIKRVRPEVNQKAGSKSKGAGSNAAECGVLYNV